MLLWKMARLSLAKYFQYNLGKITNKKDFSIRKLFLSKKAKDLRSWIVKTKCKCTYECAMSTNTLFTWPMIKKWAKKLPEELLK